MYIPLAAKLDPHFSFPSSDFVHQCNGVRELCFRLDGISQVESATHEGLPELPLHIFPCVHLVLSLNSEFGQTRPVCSSNKIFLFSHASRVEGGILYACHPITGPGNKCQNILEDDSSSLKAILPPRVSLLSDQGQPSPCTTLIRSICLKSTKCRDCNHNSADATMRGWERAGLGAAVKVFRENF